MWAKESMDFSKLQHPLENNSLSEEQVDSVNEHSSTLREMKSKEIKEWTPSAKDFLEELNGYLIYHELLQNLMGEMGCMNLYIKILK